MQKYRLYVVTYLQMLVEGSRWTKFRNKLTHGAKKIGEEAGHILEHKAGAAAVAALLRKR
jgi:hypothetical protein